MELLKNETPIIRGAHIFQDADPIVVVSTVEKFKADKKNFEAVYNTTSVATNQGIGVHTSALVMWDTTQKEFDSFRNRLMLSLGKNV